MFKIGDIIAKSAEKKVLAERKQVPKCVLENSECELVIGLDFGTFDQSGYPGTGSPGIRVRREALCHPQMPYLKPTIMVRPMVLVLEIVKGDKWSRILRWDLYKMAMT